MRRACALGATPPDCVLLSTKVLEMVMTKPNTVIARIAKELLTFLKEN
jgi:hypothetical protein